MSRGVDRAASPSRRGRTSQSRLAIDGILLFLAVAATPFVAFLPLPNPGMLLCVDPALPGSSTGRKLTAQAVLVVCLIALTFRARSRRVPLRGAMWTLIGVGAVSTLFSFGWMYIVAWGRAEDSGCSTSFHPTMALIALLSVLPGVAIVVDAATELVARSLHRPVFPAIASASGFALALVWVLTA